MCIHINIYIYTHTHTHIQAHEVHIPTSSACQSVSTSASPVPKSWATCCDFRAPTSPRSWPLRYLELWMGGPSLTKFHLGVYIDPLGLNQPFDLSSSRHVFLVFLLLTFKSAGTNRHQCGAPPGPAASGVAGAEWPVHFRGVATHGSDIGANEESLAKIKH